MENIDIIKKTLKKNNGIITAKEVEDLGINSKILTRMIEKGIIEREAICNLLGCFGVKLDKELNNHKNLETKTIILII